MSSTRVHHRGVLHYIHPSSVCMILFPCLRGTPSSAFYLVYMVPSSLDSFYIWFAVKFPAVFSSFFGPFYNYFLRAPSSHSLSSFRSWFLILDLLSLFWPYTHVSLRTDLYRSTHLHRRSFPPALCFHPYFRLYPTRPIRSSRSLSFTRKHLS